jgi:hypothetical protein
MNAIYESHQQPNVDYLYRTFKEVGLLNRLREAIEKGLKDYESTKYRPFMLVMLNFIYDPSTSDEDVDILIVILENAYKQNEKYFLEVDLLNQWIIKVHLMLCSLFQLAKSFQEGSRRESNSLIRY